MSNERRGTKALELWCRRMVEGYNVRVDNMTTSWRDGLAFCALVSKCSTLKQLPDLIHFDELKKENIYHNNELAFRVAEEYLGIPALLDPADMAAYEIPDKLSILTYLSQFYQVFGAQENSIRLSKRSSTEANKSSASTPPAKMAHVVPRREPCIKCNNPVFFAERLVIEDHLYHRTCFRCARCDSVLTLGNFYQTEKDNEFCCETCPDEEVNSKRSTLKVDESNRLSMAQRIALFEKSETTSVLKKSLSDEEKSKSLSRQHMPTSANSQALNSFLTSQIDSHEEQNQQNYKNTTETDDDEDKTNDSLSSDSESDEDNDKIFNEKSSKINVEATKISNEILDGNSVHDNSISSDKNVNSTKDPPEHDNDFKATAQVTTEAQDCESHKLMLKDTQSVGDVVLDTHKQLHDDIELEFEKLAEEAINSNITNHNNSDDTVIVAPQKLIALSPQVDTEKPQNAYDEEKVLDENKENLIVKVNVEFKEEKVEEVLNNQKTEPETVSDEAKENHSNEYPEDLNPFDDDDNDGGGAKKSSKTEESSKRPSLNPFGSCSEDEEEGQKSKSSSNTGTLQKPPRPPPPRASITFKPASTNPFGSDDEDDEGATKQKNSIGAKTPVPTPRKQLHSITPEPIPRYIHNSPGHSFKGSTSSLASSSDGSMIRRKKKKAPAPPVATIAVESHSAATSEQDSMKAPSITPKKKRPAPTPPSSTPFKVPEPSLYVTANDISTSDITATSTTENDISITSSGTDIEQSAITSNESTEQMSQIEGDQRRVIPLEESLIEDRSISQDGSHIETQEVTYRRKIVPLSPTSSDECENLEQMKDNKEAENRHRQSQSSLKADSVDSLPYINKSSHGKWKRRKGPAPSLPGFAIPQRRVLQMLPLQEIRHELEVIEVQQQGLEKQGVMLEKMIRERCEGAGDNRTTEELLDTLPSSNLKNPKEVEELILQLFELVNEKNELFRRQAELMYLRRAHRLEEEQADVEYEIRTLMAQPEHNKTDSDKAKEEALIARLVEIVQLRNEVVDCLEMDRLREAEEDLSIKQRMESHTAKLDQEYLNLTPTKLSKKEKKKLKEAKKLKNKKVNDADKDMDTSELKPESTEKKKKKKKFLF